MTSYRLKGLLAVNPYQSVLPPGLLVLHYLSVLNLWRVKKVLSAAEFDPNIRGQLRAIAKIKSIQILN